MQTMILPAVVCHADWSANPVKRWFSVAVRTQGGYAALGPELVGDPAGFLNRVTREAGSEGTTVAGFDFPIGLPARYADSIGVTDFKSFLLNLGNGSFPDFYRVCERASEISLQRPFYPYRPGGTTHAHLVAGLGFDGMDDLLRCCERKHAGRKAACPLFWTLGANQVGRAAIHGWRDVLNPALQNPACSLWPFDGPLASLVKPRQTVIVETYPAECYRWFFRERLPVRKTKPEARRQAAPALFGWAPSAKVTLAPELRHAIEAGFPQGDDAFDAVVGLFGMLEVLMERRSSSEPADVIRQVEGWIFGQHAPHKGG